MYKNTLVAIFMLLSSINIAWAEDDGVKNYLAHLKLEMATPAMQQAQIPMNDLGQIEESLSIVDNWVNLVNQANRYQLTVDEYTSVTAFKEQLRTVQIQIFPMLRQSTGFALQNKELKCKVSIKGDDFSRIWFTSQAFKDMSITQEVLREYGQLLKRLRFEQADFMLDHEDVSTLLRFKPPKDVDIVLWDEGYNRYSVFN